MSQKALAAWATNEFNLTKGVIQASISNIIKKRAELEGMDSSSLNARRQRLVQHPVEENAVAFWCSASIVGLSSPGI